MNNHESVIDVKKLSVLHMDVCKMRLKFASVRTDTVQYLINAMNEDTKMSPVTLSRVILAYSYCMRSVKATIL